MPVLAPDGRPRPDAPFGRGPRAAKVLARVIRAAAWVGGRLPARLVHALAVVGGNAEWALRPGKRRALAVNVGRAVGEPPGSRGVRRLVRVEVVNEARRSADLLWAIGRRDEFLRTVAVEGLEWPAAILQAGRGVVLAGVHVGGWEVATAVPRVVLPAPTTVVVADNWLAWAMQEVRAESGLHLVYRTSPATSLVRVLRRGEAVLVLGDDASGQPPRRHTVRFCGALADLPAGPAVLARLGGAPLVPFAVLPTGRRRWKVVFDAPVEPARTRDGDSAVLQRLADHWSGVIQRHPDWWAASFDIEWVG